MEFFDLLAAGSSREAEVKLPSKERKRLAAGGGFLTETNHPFSRSIRVVTSSKGATKKPKKPKG